MRLSVWLGPVITNLATGLEDTPHPLAILQWVRGPWRIPGGLCLLGTCRHSNGIKAAQNINHARKGTGAQRSQAKYN